MGCETHATGDGRLPFPGVRCWSDRQFAGVRCGWVAAGLAVVPVGLSCGGLGRLPWCCCGVWWWSGVDRVVVWVRAATSWADLYPLKVDGQAATGEPTLDDPPPAPAEAVSDGR